MINQVLSHFLFGALLLASTSLFAQHSWELKYDSGYAFKVIEYSAGGYYVAQSPTAPGAEGFVLSRISVLGHVLWEKSYDPGNDDYLKDLIELENGNLVVSGRINLPDTWRQGIYMFCLNPLGDTIWTQYYVNENSISFIDLEAAPNGNFIVAATMTDTILYGSRRYTLLFDSNGNQLNSIDHSLEGITIDALEYGPVGQLFAHGYYMGAEAIHKLSDSGAWKSSHPIPPLIAYSRQFRDLGSGPSGELIVLGRGTNAYTGLEDFYLTKLDSNGVKQWERHYDSAVIANPQSVSVSASGSYYMTGGILETGYGRADALVIKTDSNGTVEWSDRRGEMHESETFFSGFACSDGGLIVSGVDRDDDYMDSTWVVKYGETGVVSRSFVNADVNIPIQIYPNPASEYIEVAGTLEQAMQKLFIIDAKGKRVIEADIPHEKHIHLDVSMLPKGLYVVKVLDILDRSYIRRLTISR